MEEWLVEAGDCRSGIGLHLQQPNWYLSDSLGDAYSRVNIFAYPVGLEVTVSGAGLGLSVVLSVVAIYYPRFLSLAWNYKFASIFEWSVEGDRSNAIRVVEIINVVHRVFSNFAFLQGLGLGAWWDDSVRRMLPDASSGFMFKTRYHTTHMWYLTQLLKIGTVAMAFYWWSLYKIFRNTELFLKTIGWDRWEKCVVLGLNVGLLCAFISSADFVRLFLFVGIAIGLTSRFMTFESSGFQDMRPQ